MKIINCLIKKDNKIDNLLTIDDLKNAKNSIRNITMKDKKNVKILFLDDEGFDTGILKRLGYLDVDKMYEYNKMDDFEKYDIIFCDINGIAKEINEVFQGAALAKLIKQTYPNKIVIIFSAKQQYLLFNDFNDYVDDVIYKNIPISDLTDKIDHYINLLINPIDFWENMKKLLIKSDINTKEISKMEHYYVKSILEDKNYEKEIKKINIESKIDLANSIITAICRVIDLYLRIK